MARKKEAHHGGAWKVAYADFVTAMMALFMVLWITSQDNEILLATSQYFKQPFSPIDGTQSGMVGGKEQGSQSKSNGQSGGVSSSFLDALAKELNRMLNVNETDSEAPVEIAVTSDGLKVTLFDRNKQPLFEKDTPRLTAWGRLAFQNLAWIIERNKMRVVIEGHAAKGTESATKSYGLWELTADRSNAARRALEFYAVDAGKIDRVTGFADTRPLPKTPAEAESNQRVTISLSLN